MSSPVTSSREPLFWASAARIFATVFILFFHFNSMYDFPCTGLDIAGIGMFCFISGFFADAAKDKRTTALKWFLKRFWHIMIPYWLVIFPILISNHWIDYKPTTLFKDAVIALGGAMFFAEPVYVLSWFITLILIFYLLAVIRRVFPNPWIWGAVYAVAGWFLFQESGWRHLLYLGLFTAGMLLSGNAALNRRPQKASAFFTRLNHLFFDWQSTTYHFFLIHGAVLVGCIRILDLSWPLSLIIVLTVTPPAAWCLKKLSGIFEQRIAAQL